MAAAVLPDLIGDQRPRLEAAPDGVVANSAQDAIDLAAACGLVLDDWQQYVLRQSLGERADGKWAAYDVGLVVARQNGKGAVLMARELAGVLLFGERKIVHTAHELDTARDHMQKLYELAVESPFLQEHVDIRETVGGFKWGRGYEEVKFRNGAVIRFKARTRKGGRGLSGDLVVFDEAFELEDDALGAMQPLLRARPNPQLWYASSSVDQVSMPHAVVLTQLRDRAMSEAPGRLAFFEWSNPSGLVDGLSASQIHETISDPDVWARANPALGIRVDSEQMATEVDSMPLRQFLVECLSVGDWPDLSAGAAEDDRPLTASGWAELQDPSAQMQDPVVFAVDVAADRSAASIGAAGWTDDGRMAVELVDRRRGVGWLQSRVDELARHGPQAFVVDGYVPVDLDVEVPLLTTSAGDMAEACAGLVDAANEGRLCHLGQRDLDVAVETYKTRRLAGGFAWKPDGGDVSPLVAVTLAAWGLRRPAEAPAEPFVMYS